MATPPRYFTSGIIAQIQKLDAGFRRTGRQLPISPALGHSGLLSPFGGHVYGPFAIRVQLNQARGRYYHRSAVRTTRLRM